MKKFFAAALLSLVFALSLCACGSGDISNVSVLHKDSNIYSQQDIDSAIDVAKRYFKEIFTGCTLTEISYIGDDRNPQFQSWADRNQADEVIVLISSFETGPNPDIGLNRNGYYEQWKWVLARNNGGQWEHVNHGY